MPPAVLSIGDSALDSKRRKVKKQNDNNCDIVYTNNNKKKKQLLQSTHNSHLRTTSSQRKRHLHVASEIVVRDGTVMTEQELLSMALVGDVMWISCLSGDLEIRNTRTSELVARLIEPSYTLEQNNNKVNNKRGDTSTPAPPPTHVFHKLLNISVNEYNNKVKNTSHRIITAIHAIDSYSNSNNNSNNIISNNSKNVNKLQVWLGDNHGVVEVRDAISFERICAFTAHVGSVTCMCDFGGLMYTGSCDHNYSNNSSNSKGNFKDVKDISDEAIIQWNIYEQSVRRILCHASNKTNWQSRYYNNNDDDIYNNNYCNLQKQPRGVCAMYAEGSILVSGYVNGVIRVWNVVDGSELLHGYFHVNSGSVIALCRVGNVMWSADTSGLIVRWKVNTCEVVESVKVGESVTLQGMTQVGNRIYVSLANNDLFILSTLQNKRRSQSDGEISVLARLMSHTATSSLANLSSQYPNIHSPLTVLYHNCLLKYSAQRIACTAELSRFIVWSADADGNVRCWYQDELESFTDDMARFGDSQWYSANTTPYRELHLALQEHHRNLQKSLQGILHDPLLSPKDKKMLETLLRAYKSPNDLNTLPSLQQHLQGELQRIHSNNKNNSTKLKECTDKVNTTNQDKKIMLDKLNTLMNELKTLSPVMAEELAREFANEQRHFKEDPYNSKYAPSSSGVNTIPSSTHFSPIAATPASTSAAIPVPTISTTSTAIIPPPLPVPVPLSTSTSLPVSTLQNEQLGVPSNVNTVNNFVNSQATQIIMSTNETNTQNKPQNSKLRQGSNSQHDNDHIHEVTVDRCRWHGMIWTNPNVGNYIRRRYYGATPSLRAPDLERQERRRRRLPDVKVDPFMSSLNRHKHSVKAK